MCDFSSLMLRSVEVTATVISNAVRNHTSDLFHLCMASVPQPLRKVSRLRARYAKSSDFALPLHKITQLPTVVFYDFLNFSKNIFRCNATHRIFISATQS